MSSSNWPAPPSSAPRARCAEAMPSTASGSPARRPELDSSVPRHRSAVAGATASATRAALAFFPPTSTLAGPAGKSRMPKHGRMPHSRPSPLAAACESRRAAPTEPHRLPACGDLVIPSHGGPASVSCSSCSNRAAASAAAVYTRLSGAVVHWTMVLHRLYPVGGRLIVLGLSDPRHSRSFAQRDVP